MMAYATDRASLERDCDVDIFTGGGPGGQNRNKTQNAVRLHHRPSGLIVAATERRSLEANRNAAFERLQQKLEALNYRPPPRHATKPTRSSKRKRLEGKARHSRKKADRRGNWD